MSFFERYNQTPFVKRAAYKPIPQLPIFRLLKLKDITAAKTSLGDAVKVNALLAEDEELFFYMNKEDSKKITAEDMEFLRKEILEKRNPFCFVAKTKPRLVTVLLPFALDLATHFVSGSLIPLDIIPNPVREEMNFEELARNGIQWE